MGKREHRERTILSGKERGIYGCIATLREQRTRSQRVVHIPGLLPERIQLLADFVDWRRGHDEDWRIVTLSMPDTIYRDLNGDRDLDQSVEEQAVGYIGRPDLLEPPRRTVLGAERNMVGTYAA